MEQLSMLDYPWRDEVQVRLDAPETSAAAADSVLSISGKQRRAVYDFIASQGDYGATLDEITDALEMNPSSARPRRKELEDDGLVIDSGQRRKTNSDRDAIVWVAK